MALKLAIILILILFTGLFFMYWLWRTLDKNLIAIYFPARRRDLARIDKVANLKKGNVFYELGSGDTRVCRYIAEQNPKSRVVGIEALLPLFLWGKWKQLVKPIPNLELKWGNLFRFSFEDADVVYFYALPKTFEKLLKPKLREELKPGSRIVSYAFSAEEWVGEQYRDRPKEGDIPINVYEV